MTKLIWGTVGNRLFEVGVDRGVLYVDNNPGVPWDGLTSVTEEPTGGEPVPYYADGLKYLNIASAEEFEATLEAFSSPSEFDICDGTAAIYAGLFITQQPRKQFGLSYRTRVGNDTEAQDYGYKIHLVYNALSSPSQRAHVTLNDESVPITLSWHISTIPPAIASFRPSAHLMLDSTKSDLDLMSILEGYLYGADGIPSTLLSPSQLSTLVGSWVPLELTARLNFIGIFPGNPEELPEGGTPGGYTGDTYLIDNDLWIFNDGEWQNFGPIPGAPF